MSMLQGVMQQQIVLIVLLVNMSMLKGVMKQQIVLIVLVVSI